MWVAVPGRSYEVGQTLPFEMITDALEGFFYVCMCELLSSKGMEDSVAPDEVHPWHSIADFRDLITVAGPKP